MLVDLERQMLTLLVLILSPARVKQSNDWNQE